MTAPQTPYEVIRRAFIDEAFDVPDTAGEVAVTALGEANFAIVHLPQTMPAIQPGTPGVLRAKIGNATVRVDASTGALRNVILDTVICHTLEEAVALTADLVAVIAWARLQEGGAVDVG